MKYAYIQDALPYPFIETDLDIPRVSTGKVRDIYQENDTELLLVTTDRLSAFDKVLGAAPFKGQVLTQLSSWWFKQIEDIVPSHLVDLPDPSVMRGVKVEPFPVEVIVRGFISGVTKTAIWYRYDELGEREIYGHTFPEGLTKNQKLPVPIITPTTKGGPTGHDERLTIAEVTELGYLDEETWAFLQDAALKIFALGQQVAAKAGLILVDTKYEFGPAPDGRILIIDEVHTPDSSRYWRADSYEERIVNGLEPENFDKEFVRLEYAKKGYRGDGEPPEMDANLWERVSERYITLYEKLTGETFVPGEYPAQERIAKNLGQG